MDLITFRKSLESGKRWRVYWLAGTDPALRQVYVRKIAAHRLVYETWEAFRAALQQRPLWAGDAVPVLYGDAAVAKQPREAFEGVWPAVIVCAPSAPSWAEDAEAVVVRCTDPTPVQVFQHAQAKVDWSDEVVEALVVLAGGALEAVEEELQQLRYVEAPVTVALMEQLWGEGVPDADEDVLLDWIGNRPAPVIAYWQRHGSDGLFRMVAQLYTVIKQQMILMGYADWTEAELIARAGLTSGQVYRWRRIPMAYSLEQGLERLLWLHQVEVAVRSGILTKEQAWGWLIGHWFVDVG